MPQRFLRPGITNSERWNAVSFEAQSLFIRILTLVDDFGRYDARIPILHGQCFALRPDVKPLRTAALRSELQQAGLIQVYEVEGREYLQMAQWQERTRSERSKFPDPLQVPQISTSAGNGSGPQDSAASIVHRPSSIASTSSSLVPRRKRGARVPLECAAFIEFWAAYPRKEAKANAEEAWVANQCADKLPQILVAVRNAKISDQWTKESGRWIPHPATWLNRRGWEDELLPQRSNGIRENIKPKIIHSDDL